MVSLEECRERLRRGEEHASALRKSLTHTFDTYGNRTLSVQKNYQPNTGRFTFRVGKAAPWQSAWAILLGETIYNFMCSLDYLAYIVARELGGIRDPKKLEKVYFPVVLRSKDFGGAIGKLGSLPKEVRTLFDRHQPYRGRPRGKKSPLAVLKRLNNADKHRNLQAVEIHVAEQTAVFDPATFAHCVYLEHGFKKSMTILRAKPNAQIGWIKVRPTNTEKPNVNVKFRFHAAPALTEGLWLYDTLRDIADRIEAILADFEPHLVPAARLF